MSEPEEATHNAKVISFINMKGGVGKTTLCIGLATCMSNTGKKVLVIDSDPQFNATQSLLDDYKAKETQAIIRSEIQRLNSENPSTVHTEDDIDESEFSYYNQK
ncbi:ParA family protein, partial [Lactiplantibacillus plantarum]|uniref:ParA family protein n=3 Tax=Lactobacillales TaxID=186826 RepID=UPI003F539A63